MANATWTSAPGGMTSAAAFRAWGLAISTALQAVGLVKTSDTGQIDWTTVAAPSSSGNIQGYEIYRFSDALQATAPVFLRVTYGSGANGQYPGVRFAVGAATDGAGNLTTSYNHGAMYGTSTDSGTRTSWISFDGSGLAIAFHVDAAVIGNRGLFVIDRTRNADGTPNGDGLVCFYEEQAGNGAQTMFSYKLRRWFALPRAQALHPAPLSGATSLAWSGDTYVAQYYALIPNGSGLQRVKMLLCPTSADFGLTSNFSIDHLGAARTYRAMGPNMGFMDSKGQTNASAAIWWSD